MARSYKILERGTRNPLKWGGGKGGLGPSPKSATEQQHQQRNLFHLTFDSFTSMRMVRVRVANKKGKTIKIKNGSERTKAQNKRTNVQVHALMSSKTFKND